ncbi:hypothetical protein ZHAS_00004486 [Anopheles sinensis]|uniref:Uncharacterized protein n=1 Tax=Anopheles sinensis TaxID=74873 RepID=A0A084VH22_ANOSI|nr:hypothetical protein ZHAS_00004486 [Anopheles sinensis]
MIHHIVVSDTMTYCFCGRGVFRPWIPAVPVAVTTSFIPCRLAPYYIYPGINIHPSMAPGETLRAPGVHPGPNQNDMQQIYTQVWVMQTLSAQSVVMLDGINLPCNQPRIGQMPSMQTGLVPTVIPTVGPAPMQPPKMQSRVNPSMRMPPPMQARTQSRFIQPERMPPPMQSGVNPVGNRPRSRHPRVRQAPRTQSGLITPLRMLPPIQPPRMQESGVPQVRMPPPM